MEKVKTHVMEAGRTVMAQVDAGTYDVRDSMSRAERAIVENSETLRQDYAANRISAKHLLQNAACHFDDKEVVRVFSDLKENPPKRFTQDAEDVDDPEAPNGSEEDIQDDDSDGKSD